MRQELKISTLVSNAVVRGQDTAIGDWAFVRRLMVFYSVFYTEVVVSRDTLWLQVVMYAVC